MSAEWGEPWLVAVNLGEHSDPSRPLTFWFAAASYSPGTGRNSRIDDGDQWCQWITTSPVFARYVSLAFMFRICISVATFF